MTRRTFLVPLFAAAFILAPSELSGQVRPLSGPFEISPRSYGSTEPGHYTTRLPTTAALADGSFLAAWGEDLEVIPPGGPSVPFFDLYARKIDAAADSAAREPSGNQTAGGTTPSGAVPAVPPAPPEGCPASPADPSRRPGPA